MIFCNVIGLRVKRRTSVFAVQVKVIRSLSAINMPRYQKNRSSPRKMQEKKKEKKKLQTRVEPNSLSEDSQTDCDSTSKNTERERAVEVIHWIPASAGSVIQIPVGQVSEHFSIELHKESHQAGEVSIFHSDTV